MSIPTLDPLPELATRAVLFTILPLVMCLWFNSRTLLGYAPVIFFLWWEYSIEFGTGLDNVLNIYTGVDYQDAMFVFFVIYGSLTICFCGVALLVGFVFNIPGLLPFYALFTASDDSPIAIHGTKFERPAAGYTGLNRHGIVNIPRPWIHCLVTFILFCFTVIAPFVIYDQFEDARNSHAAYPGVAWGLGMGIAALGYFGCFLFWWFYTDIYVWGPTATNIAMGKYNTGGTMQVPDAIKKNIRTLEWGAKVKIIVTVCVIAFVHLASVLVMYTIRYIKADVNWCWPAAVVIGGILLILCIIAMILLAYFNNNNIMDYFYMRTVYDSSAAKKKIKELEDELVKERQANQNNQPADDNTGEVDEEVVDDTTASSTGMNAYPGLTARSAIGNPLYKHI